MKRSHLRPVPEYIFKMSESEATHDGLYFILFLYNIFIITNMYFIFIVFLEPQRLNICDLINYKLGLPINERFWLPIIYVMK